MDYLEVVDGAGRRRRVELDRARLLIGREPSCDICLPHPGVSRRHAQLQATEQGRWLLLNTHAGDVSARIEPFDAIELELWRLWGRSEPR